MSNYDIGLDKESEEYATEFCKEVFEHLYNPKIVLTKEKILSK